MKKILLISHEMSITGAVVSLLSLAIILKEEGYAIKICTLKNGEFEKQYRELGFDVYKLLSVDEVINNDGWIPDLVICNTIITYEYVHKLKKHYPLIWLIHEGTNILEYIKRNKDIEKVLTEKNVIYVVSEYVQSFLKHKFNLDSKILHNYIEDNYFSRNFYEDMKVFIVCGSISERKAQNDLIMAYEKLEDEIQKKCIIKFIGDLPQRANEYTDYFLKEVDRFPNLIYKGKMDRNDIFEEMAISDAIIVPSKDESCSLVALEGAMLGKPLLISENVGAKYVVDDNESGWIFETGNIRLLSTKISEIVNQDKIKLEMMGRKSRNNFLKTTSKAIYSKNLVDMVESAVQTGITYEPQDDINWNKYIENKHDDILSQINEKTGGLSANSRIALYGANDRAVNFYKWFRDESDFTLVGWFDKECEKSYVDDVDILLPKELKNIIFDFVFVIVKTKRVYDEIKNELNSMGIIEEKIIWIEYAGVV